MDDADKNAALQRLIDEAPATPKNACHFLMRT
jgi:hypothetical protein